MVRRSSVSHVVHGNKVMVTIGKEASDPILTVYYDGIREALALTRADDGSWIGTFDTSGVKDDVVFWHVHSTTDGCAQDGYFYVMHTGVGYTASH
jgi:hypothetical protein